MDTCGDDVIYLHSGDNNYIDAGIGNDIIQNLNPLSNGTYRGENGNDRIAVANGQVWGDLGVDFFHVVPTVLKNINLRTQSYALVSDYTVGVDVIYSDFPLTHSVSERGLWLGVEGFEESMLIANVFDINLITFER